MNRKEEVINIELTQYGKHLLSVGKFKPEYYSFFDDDVLYDSTYAGTIDEAQNDIHDRIKDVPQSSPQAVFKGVETEILAANRFIRMGERDDLGVFSRLYSSKVQSTPEKHYALSAPLGTISLESANGPAWNVNVLKGEITGSVLFQTGDQPTLKIPQINLKPIEFITKAERSLIGSSEADLEIDSEGPSDLNFLIKNFSDGSYIETVEDSIVLEIQEENTIFGNENFDIEVFEVSTSERGSNTEKQLIPLYFAKKKKSLIRNNILLDDDEIEGQNKISLDLDSSCVEYYFDIFTEEEQLDEDVLCKIENSKDKNFLISKAINNNDTSNKIRDARSLYDTNVLEEDIDPKC